LEIDDQFQLTIKRKWHYGESNGHVTDAVACVNERSCHGSNIFGAYILDNGWRYGLVYNVSKGHMPDDIA